MENDPVVPDPPKQPSPAPARDPLIRYSVFAALGCAGVCMLCTILYVFSYSLDSTLSFERHFDAYISSGNTANLSTVLGLHMAQNRMFLQSCGMVAGIFFAFLGLALFLVGIQGTADANGQIRDYSTSVKRLAPGGIILLASMIFVGVSAMHPIAFEPGPGGPSAVPTAMAAPPTAAPPTAAPATTPPAAAAPSAEPTAPATQPATQSELQPAPQTAPAAHLAPQSATITPSQPIIQLLTPTRSTPAQPAPATQPTPRPVYRPALVPVNQTASTAPPLHHFIP